MTDFEIIVVDDCSTDDTVDVIEKYADSHDNLRIIKHDANKRQGGAKNTGIRHAKGKYIAFADQDDMVVTGNLIEVYEIAKEDSSDIISFGWFECNEGETLRRGIKIDERKHLTGVSFCEQFFDTSSSLAPWSYLYRLGYLKEQSRPMAENVLMEDADWVAWHLIHAKIVYCVNIPIYRWMRNPESITAGVTYQHKADWVLFGLRKIEDSIAYHTISSRFAFTMSYDGHYNIEQAVRKLWETDHYNLFFKRLGDNLFKLQKKKWSFRTNWIFHHPKSTCLILSIVGPFLITIKKARSFRVISIGKS